MLRLIRTIVLIAIALVIGYWAGFAAGQKSGARTSAGPNTPQGGLAATERTLEELLAEKERLAKQNEQLRRTAADAISALQKSVVGASGQIVDNAPKLLSKEELGDRLIELGEKLKDD